MLYRNQNYDILTNRSLYHNNNMYLAHCACDPSSSSNQSAKEITRTRLVVKITSRLSSMFMQLIATEYGNLTTGSAGMCSKWGVAGGGTWICCSEET